MIISCVILCLLAYLIGSIPVGLLLGRLMGLGDIRQQGSGNIGATNMVRAGGKMPGALTLLLDAGKGVLAVQLTFWLLSWFDSVSGLCVLLTGIFAVTGHIFPVWLKFKGGKGVATTIGVLLAWHWLTGLAFIGIWLATFMLKRVSSLAALSAALLTPLAACLIPDHYGAIAVSVLSLLLFYSHRENIRRLLKGEEHAFRGNSQS